MAQKRKVIISGVSSFVGCHLAKAFAQDWDVTALTSLAQDTYDGIRAKRLAHIQQDVTFQTCDLTDGVAVQKLVEDVQPHLWIQHGGFAQNYASAEYDLSKSFAVNVVALKPLYQALNKVGACIILTGSNAEYGPNNQANGEEDACWPDTPYGLSKLAETIEAKRLSALYQVRTRVARLYIPVGPMDAPGKLMDHVITNLKSDTSVDLSPCKQKRDFLAVADVCDAYLKLADDMARGSFDIFNICSGEAKELKSLLLDVCKTMDKPTELLNFGAFPMRAGEPMVSFGSNEKVERLLGWVPSAMEDCLKRLIHD